MRDTSKTINTILKHGQDRSKMTNFALAVFLGDPMFQDDLPILMERMVAKVEGADCNIILNKEGYLDVLEVLPGNSTYILGVIDTMLTFAHWKDRLAAKDYTTVADKVNEMDLKRVAFHIGDMNIHISSLPEVMASMLDKEVIDPEICSEYTTYEHHGELMVTRHIMKGHHKSYWLCYDCDRFMPDDLNNCHKAQIVYDNCVELGMVTPVWECTDFVENAEGLELVKKLGEALIAEAEAIGLDEFTVDAIEEERVA